MVRLDQWDYALATWLAPRHARPQVALVLRLHARLSTLSAGVREPMLAAIKQAWWREQLAALDTGQSPAEPLLQALSALQAHGVSGQMLSAMADDDTASEALATIMAQLCDGRTHPARLIALMQADDARRIAAQRPLASPARRTLWAIRIGLIGW